MRSNLIGNPTETEAILANVGLLSYSVWMQQKELVTLDLPLIPPETTFTSRSIGDRGRVYMADDRVIKMPISPSDQTDKDRDKLLFEADTLATVEDKDCPLEMPQVQNTGLSPLYFEMSRVSGEDLPPETVDTFTQPEKESLGKKIGQFVVWMSKKIDPPTYDEIYGFWRQPQLADILNKKTAYKGYGKYKTGHNQLDSILTWFHTDPNVLEEKKVLQATPALPIIGHDDLRFDNLMFSRDEGKWELTGVIDFGETKRSFPERELRHILRVSEVAGLAAKKTYEEITGDELSLRLMYYCALGQAAMTTTYSYNTESDKFPRRLQNLQDLFMRSQRAFGVDRDTQQEHIS